MCTVSFVRSGNKIILTSNRDEAVERPALAPQLYAIGHQTVYYPKDPKAGGTWFVVSEKANVIVLLNGASEKHQWKPPYRKSRGLIVLDLIAADSPVGAWNNIDLNAIEPFTLIVYEQAKLHQLRWNGLEKETVALNAHQSHIWSSAPLYPQDVREKRAQWLGEFLAMKPNVSASEMFDFHRHTEASDHENGLVISRYGLLQTLSITQVVLENDRVRLSHHDLIGQSESEHSFLTTAH